MLLVGGYTGDRGSATGISVIDGDQVSATVPLDSPTWLARHPFLPVLYAATETDAGRVHAWALRDGAPAESLGSGDTGGADPTHLTVDPDGQFLVTANYGGGSISVHRLGPDGSIGERTDLVQLAPSGLPARHPRQEDAHPHMVCAIPGGLLVVDLGADAIYRYRLSPAGTLELDGVVATPAGSGPRHVLPIGDHYYVTAELSGQVLVYDSSWNLLAVVPASAGGQLSEPVVEPADLTLPSTGHEQNFPSDLASDGRFLYVANRGPDTVSVFELGTSPLPRYVTEVAVGDWPRHLVLDDGLLYVANQLSHEVTRMRVDPETGIPSVIETIEVPSPTVVLP